MSNKLQGGLAHNTLTEDSNNSTKTCAKKTSCNINCLVYMGVIKSEEDGANDLKLNNT